MSVPGDPLVHGPGGWMIIHILGYHAKTKEEHLSLCKTYRIIANNLPCPKCRRHALEFIKLNPPEGAVTNEETCMFRWSVDWHNYVNRINSKAIVDWKFVHKNYSLNAPTCNGDCNAETTEVLSPSGAPQREQKGPIKDPIKEKEQVKGGQSGIPNKDARDIKDIPKSPVTPALLPTKEIKKPTGRMDNRRMYNKIKGQ